MATVKLKVSEKILDQFLRFIRQFNSEELEILETDSEFERNKKYLHDELRRYENGEAETYSIEELKEILDKTIRRHED